MGEPAGPQRRGRPIAEDRVADAGHELKTPLSVILGLSGRLLAGDATPAQRRDLERIRANAYGLLAHVEALLEAASIEGGAVALNRAPCDLAALIRDAAGGFSSLLEERSARLVLDVPPSLDAQIDEARVGTVLTNLLANAVRYAPRGGVVRCSAARAGADVRIEVADSGPGVPAADRDAIFERFHQVADSAHRRAGGTGLGLAIVRDLVALHDGAVSVGDAPEGGALFTVTLPHEAADAAPAAPPLGPDLRERERATVEALAGELRAMDRRGRARAGGGGDLPCVLVVTAAPVLGLYVEDLLADDYDVRHAVGAAEALRIAHGEALDAALIDVGRPGGKAVLGALRAGPGEPVPVVVLAADAAHARQIVQETGAEDYIVQPFASDELLVRLGALVGRRRAESARAEADARFRAVFEQVPTAMALAGEDGRILEANEALAAMLGLPRARLRGLTLDDLSHPDDVLAGDAVDGSAMRLARRLVAADGRVLATRLTVSAIREEGAPRQLVIQVDEAAGRRLPEAGSPALGRALSAQLARCLRYGERAALLLVEVDEPVAGEGGAARLRALAGVARTVRRRLRRSDVLMRAGERRFAALVIDAGVEEAEAVGRAVRDALSGVGAALAVRPIDPAATAGQIMAEAEAALRVAAASRVRTSTDAALMEGHGRHSS